jgi:hypothetical protein
MQGRVYAAQLAFGARGAGSAVGQPGDLAEDVVDGYGCGRRAGSRWIVSVPVPNEMARSRRARHELGTEGDSPARARDARRAVFARAFAAAEVAGWSTLSLQRVLTGLQLAVERCPDRQPIPISELHVILGATRGARLERVAQVLLEEGCSSTTRCPRCGPGSSSAASNSRPGSRTTSGRGCWGCSTVTPAPGPARHRRSTATSGGPDRTCWSGLSPAEGCARSPRTTCVPCSISYAGTAWRARSSRCDRCSGLPNATG